MEDNGVEVKPTWRLAWGLFWRQALIGTGVALVVYLPLYVFLLVGLIATG